VRRLVATMGICAMEIGIQGGPFVNEAFIRRYEGRYARCSYWSGHCSTVGVERGLDPGMFCE
jgi:hypothetical protein